MSEEPKTQENPEGQQAEFDTSTPEGRQQAIIQVLNNLKVKPERIEIILSREYELRIGETTKKTTLNELIDSGGEEFEQALGTLINIKKRLQR